MKTRAISRKEWDAMPDDAKYRMYEVVEQQLALIANHFAPVEVRGPDADPFAMLKQREKNDG